MADTVQMNLNVLPATREKLKEMADLTFRNPGQMLDLIVAEAHKRICAEVSPTLAVSVSAETVPGLKSGGNQEGYEPV